tara:strand:- start:1721 stop:2533 length:813 start_codon:yes stop_codon:yes gene_type:complete
MKDLTYILPVRIESEDRLKNVITSVSFLLKHIPEAKVLVKEVDTRSNFKFRALPKIKEIVGDVSNLKHIFEESSDPFFHKTKILNDLILAADTKILCSHDVDVVYPKHSHEASYKAIEDGECDVVYPYGCGVYQYQVDYPIELFEKFVEKNHDLFVLEDNCRMESSTIGWTQFYSKDAVVKGGMWNENFISWGAEDCEFYFRFNILGFKVGRLNNALWHFEHERTQNSHYHNPKFRENHELWQRLRNCTRDQVISYYNSQPYLKERYASL